MPGFGVADALCGRFGTRIELPTYRDEHGVWCRAITLPDEICGPMGRAVLDELVERGLAIRGPSL